jgi:hypothetical protein
MSKDWSPGPKYRAYLNEIQDILSDDEPRSLRGVYYAMESRGFPDKLRRKSYDAALDRHERDPEKYPHPADVPEDEWRWDFAYRYVKKAVRDGRRARYIEPRLIVDTSRSAGNEAWSGYDDAEDFVDRRIRDAERAYRENFWKEQDTYVEVWLEKQSLASVFAPICEEWNVRLEPLKGDWSDSKVYQAAQRLIPPMKEGKDVRILYFGDYNPSGYHAPVSVLERMGYYGVNLHRPFPDAEHAAYYDSEWGMPVEMEGGSTFGVERIAMTTEIVERFDLPENPSPSGTDKDEKLKEHFQEYVSDGRDVNIELDALKEYHRDLLEGLIEEGIKQHVDLEAKERVEERVKRERERIRRAVSVDDSVLNGDDHDSDDDGDAAESEPGTDADADLPAGLLVRFKSTGGSAAETVHNDDDPCGHAPRPDESQVTPLGELDAEGHSLCGHCSWPDGAHDVLGASPDE